MLLDLLVGVLAAVAALISHLASSLDQLDPPARSAHGAEWVAHRGGRPGPRVAANPSADQTGRLGHRLPWSPRQHAWWSTWSYFVPDFIARDPLTGRVIAVESKMGSGAHFTPGQLDGYEKLAQGQPLEARSAAMQRELDRYRITGVSEVQVFRWNTELVPDQALINAAGLAGKVKP